MYSKLAFYRNTRGTNIYINIIVLLKWSKCYINLVFPWKRSKVWSKISLEKALLLNSECRYVLHLYGRASAQDWGDQYKLASKITMKNCRHVVLQKPSVSLMWLSSQQVLILPWQPPRQFGQISWIINWSSNLRNCHVFEIAKLESILNHISI